MNDEQHPAPLYIFGAANLDQNKKPVHDALHPGYVVFKNDGNEEQAKGCGACGDGCPGKQCQVEADSPPIAAAPQVVADEPTAEDYSDMLRDFFFRYAAGGYNDDGGLVPLAKAKDKLQWVINEEGKRAAPVQAQEPVAWRVRDGDEWEYYNQFNLAKISLADPDGTGVDPLPAPIPLYAAPVQPVAVPQVWNRHPSIDGIKGWWFNGTEWKALPVVTTPTQPVAVPDDDVDIAAPAAQGAPACSGCGATAGADCNDRGCGGLDAGNGEPAAQGDAKELTDADILNAAREHFKAGDGDVDIESRPWCLKRGGFYGPDGLPNEWYIGSSGGKGPWPLFSVEKDGTVIIEGKIHRELSIGRMKVMIACRVAPVAKGHLRAVIEEALSPYTIEGGRADEFNECVDTLCAAIAKVVKP